MKLRVRFLQLPILFDAGRLAQEVAAIPESAWRPHPKKFKGNDALALITTGGDPFSDARAGAMGPTPELLACPYLMQVLETLGATWGRSRLMRLSGDAEVTAHVDTDYYWRDHMRVHVPIITQPTVRFLCGGEEVNMAAGECWIFDTWSLHSVHNDATHARIHLVADTVGGDGLLDLIEKGRSPREANPDWAPISATPSGNLVSRLAYESRNVPDVMTPWELRDHLGFLLSEVVPGQPQMAPISQALNRLRVNWHALWARSGDNESARPEYAALLGKTWSRLESLGVHSLVLKNQMALGLSLKAIIFDSALGAVGAAMDEDNRAAPAASGPSTAAALHRSSAEQAPSTPAIKARTGRDALFDSPIFIVSSPRSGSSLLFETLSGAKNLYTIGGESHGLMEAIPAINPASRGWRSNRLTQEDAVPDTVAALRERFRAALRDRESRRPPAGPVRMLEKTPKNALRIPFLAAAFPEAQFIYLYRDPRPTLASMIEAWGSGRFRTYPLLPGWAGPAWSLLLIPDWQALNGAPLNQVVAQQWATTTEIMLDDLQALPSDKWRTISYEAFTAAPQPEISTLCKSLGLAWDRPIGADLPLARNAVSAPDPQKWRIHSGAIDAVWPLILRQHERALSVIANKAEARA